MQVHEITKKTDDSLNEGVWDTASNIKSGVGQTLKSVGTAVKNPVQAAKALTSPSNGDSLGNRIQSQKQDKAITQFSNKAYDTWTRFVAQKNQTFQTPQEKAQYYNSTGYKDDLIKFFEKNFFKGQHPPQQTIGLFNQLAINGKTKYASEPVAEASATDLLNKGGRALRTGKTLAKKGYKSFARGAKSGYNNQNNQAYANNPGATNAMSSGGVANKAGQFVGRAGAKAVDMGKKAGPAVASAAKNLGTQTDVADRKIFTQLIRLAMVNNTLTPTNKNEFAPVRIISQPNAPAEAMYLGKKWTINHEGVWVSGNTVADDATSQKLTAKLNSYEDLHAKPPDERTYSRNLDAAMNLVRDAGYEIERARPPGRLPRE
jgi:hypothetical protein